MNNLKLYFALISCTAALFVACNNNSPKKASAETEDSSANENIASKKEEPADKQSEEEEITLRLNGYELSFGEGFKIIASSDDNDGYILSYKDYPADIRFYAEVIPEEMEEIYELSCQSNSTMELQNLSLEGKICKAKPEYYFYIQKENTRIILYIKSEESFLKENEKKFRSIFSDIRKTSLAS